MYIASILTLYLAATPAPASAFVEALKNAECTLVEPDRTAESVFLPGGGEVETIITGSSMRVNFYLDGERVLTASETDGRVDVDLTEYGLALAPERAAEFSDEVVRHVPALMESPEGCTGPLASKADQTAKCGLIGLGAAALGGLAGTAVGGPLGGFLGGAAGGSLGVLCAWLVDKVCEESSAGC